MLFPWNSCTVNYLKLCRYSHTEGCPILPAISFLFFKNTVPAYTNSYECPQPTVFKRLTNYRWLLTVRHLPFLFMQHRREGPGRIHAEILAGTHAPDRRPGHHRPNHAHLLCTPWTSQSTVLLRPSIALCMHQLDAEPGLGHEDSIVTGRCRLDRETTRRSDRAGPQCRRRRSAANRHMEMARTTWPLLRPPLLMAFLRKTR